MIREEMSKDELKGEPEMDQSKTQKSTDSAATDIPQTNQPANGVAPSGGEFDSNDKKGDKAGDEASAMATKPSSDYKRIDAQKNALNKESKISQARNLMEQAKQLLKEANEPDPSQPMPGEVTKEPEKMEGEEPNKSPNGGTESPNNMSASSKESLDLDNNKLIESMYAHLKKENAQEEFNKRMGSQRQSLVGSSAVDAESFKEKINAKSATTNTIKEYLQKSGNTSALRIMSGVQ
jgi:hypothetical protein